jgi:hypothetical protein
VIADRVKVFAETGKPMRRKDGGEYHLTLEEYATVFPTPTADAAIGAVPTPEMAERFRRKGRSGSFVEAVAATMFPTPKASDGENGGCGELLALVRGKKTRQLWPTPQACDSKRGADARDRPGSGGPNLSHAVGGGQLNPTWVEWLMGFPLGWTDCAASETPSCPKSSS